MEIRKITLSERACALELVFRTFMKYEAPDYSKEGVESFRKSVIDNKDFLNHIVLHGAFQGEEIRGVIATRNQGNHIALFFVDEKYHQQGIGKSLFQTVLQKCNSNEMTVHSSPYAVRIYQHLGFVETAPEQITDGIRYTPMIYQKILRE